MRMTAIKPASLPTAYDELVRLFPPRAIRDEVDYENTQAVIDTLTSLPHPTRAQSEYLDTLTVLLEAWEEQHETGFAAATPLQVLRFLMDEHGMSASDLGRLLGERSLGAKVLSGQRDLSKSHIRALARHFGIRADLFL